MQTVTVERTVDASPQSARERLRDLESLMEPAGFDEVEVDDGRVRVCNHVGLATLELTVAVREAAGAALAYEQVDGIFDAMDTRYEVEPAEDGSRVTATTEFELGAPGVGSILDATVIARQRRRELTAQLESLDADAGTAETPEAAD